MSGFQRFLQVQFFRSKMSRYPLLVNYFCSSLQISQSINLELLTCTRNGKDINSCLYEDKKILGRPINKKSKGQRKNLFVNLQCLLTSLLIRLVREH